MPHENVDATRAWLRRALRDIASARNLCKNKPPLTDTAVFHAQQAAEKSLKGFLTWHRVSFQKTHDLEEIAGQILEIEPRLESLLKRAPVLTPFAVVFRYPGEDKAPPLTEARKLISLAEEIFTSIILSLPEETRLSSKELRTHGVNVGKRGI